MFIGLSKTVARFGGFRFGIGLRATKKNMLWAVCLAMLVWCCQLIWSMIVLAFWLMYALIYFMFWLFKKMFKTSIPFIEKLLEKIADECNKKTGNQA